MEKGDWPCLFIVGVWMSGGSELNVSLGFDDPGKKGPDLWVLTIECVCSADLKVAPKSLL